jgi:threonine dehydrogenase-like Zn-dependent dehydrogenase
VLNIIRNVEIKENEPVLVVGCGEGGLLAAQAFEAHGADVYLAGNNRWNLGVARQLGMTNTLNWGESGWTKKLMDNTAGVGPGIVIETKGEKEGIRKSLEVLRNGGDLVLTQLPVNEDSIALAEIIKKGIRIIGNNRTNFPDAIDMLAKKRIEVKRLVNKEFKLEEGNKAFELAAEESTTKVLINI